jgi:hypothetical protein
MSAQVLPPDIGPDPKQLAGKVFKVNSLAQKLFMESTAPELLLSSAYGKGKSFALCNKLDMLCRMWPNSFVVLARKTRASMGATTLTTLLDEVITPSHKENYWKNTADGGSTLFYPNGSRILAIGLDNPGRARSAAFNGAGVDQAEELDEEEWNAISGRLRLRAGDFRQLMAVCNPDSPDHFLFGKFRPDRGTHKVFSDHDEKLPNGIIIPKGTLKTETIISGGDDNVANWPLDYAMRMSRLTGRYRQRYMEGKWVAFEGAVYDNFEFDIHVKPAPKEWAAWGGYPPPSWSRYRGVDFGFQNPTCVQWWTKSPEGIFYLYREIYYSKRIVREHARTIREEEKKELDTLRYFSKLNRADEEYVSSLNITMSVADHDAEDRATLDSEGISTFPANKERTPGVQTVYEMLTPVKVGDKWTSGIVFVKNALVEVDPILSDQGKPICTYEEMPVYRYPKQRMGIQYRSPREDPADLNDHGMDCMRYILHTAKMAGDFRIIWL